MQVSYFPRAIPCALHGKNGYEGTVAIIARGINHCGASVWSEPFYTQVEACLGEEILNPGIISIYPNPAGERFYVTLKEGMGIPAFFTLYNLMGIHVFEASLETSQTPIDCRALPAGIYFWTIRYQEKWAKGKIILQPSKDH